MSEGGGADLYQALAPIYDDWQASDGMTPFALLTAAKLKPLLEREARAHRSRSQAFSFLDLGCGTATLLCALREQQPTWRLAGVDASAAMLAVAAGKPTAPTLELARASVEGALPLVGPFDAVGGFYDTLNHLPDVHALGRVFRTVSKLLRPGGLLIFDLTNRRGFERWWRGRNDFFGPGWRISVEARFDPESERGRAEVTIAEAGGVQTFQLAERHLEEPEVLQALAAAGFTVERTEGWAPFTHDVEGKTWWVARLSRKSQSERRIDSPR
jgi:SAM-dependent methyltransferase